MGLLGRMNTPPPKKRPGVGTSFVPIVTHPQYGTSFTVPRVFAEEHKLGPFAPQKPSEHVEQSIMMLKPGSIIIDPITGKETKVPKRYGGRRNRNKKTVKHRNRQNKTKRNLRK
jgi:hypothetical protein